MPQFDYSIAQIYDRSNVRSLQRKIIHIPINWTNSVTWPARYNLTWFRLGMLATASKVSQRSSTKCITGGVTSKNEVAESTPQSSVSLTAWVLPLILKLFEDMCCAVRYSKTYRSVRKIIGNFYAKKTQRYTLVFGPIGLSRSKSWASGTQVMELAVRMALTNRPCLVVMMNELRLLHKSVDCRAEINSGYT